MYRILITIALLVTSLFQKSFAQDSTAITTSDLLRSYYDIKNALVSGNANSASVKAQEFVKILEGITTDPIDKAIRNALNKDAEDISGAKEIKQQRATFEGFSNNMYAIVKSQKTHNEPVYYAWCPMKKAHWLSKDATIRNPYFGSAMLTCGKVEETLK